MTLKETIAEVSKNFVNAKFRDRFVYEAFKKKGRLHGRICHSIEEVFNEKYETVGEVCFSDDHEFYDILDDNEIVSWSEFKKSSYLSGDGHLLISVCGKCFYAETEANYGSPTQVYSGKI